jgi:hypothetical protein
MACGHVPIPLAALPLQNIRVFLLILGAAITPAAGAEALWICRFARASLSAPLKQFQIQTTIFRNL